MKRFDTNSAFNVLLDEGGAFFAFGQSQFEEKKQKGIKYVALNSGLICPKDRADALVEDERVKWELQNNSKEDIIWYELGNDETQISGDTSSAVDSLKAYGFSEEEVKVEYKAYFKYCCEEDMF